MYRDVLLHEHTHGTDHTAVSKMMAAGMDDFFPKPVDMKALLKHLDGKFVQLAR